MSGLKPSRCLALAVVLLGSITAGLTLAPREVVAQNASPWATVTVPTNGDTVADAITMDNDGDKIGAMFIGGTTGRAYFAYLASATGAWVLQNTDVNSMDSTGTDSVRGLVSMGGGTWVAIIQNSASGAFRVFRSLNDGVGWALQLANLGAVTAGSYFDMKNLGGAIGIIDKSSTIQWKKSSDLGATWTTAVSLNDNQGAASAGGGSTSASVIKSAYAVDLAQGYQRVFMEIAGGALYIITSDLVGDFWSIIYTATGGSTLKAAITNANCPTAQGTPNTAAFAGNYWVIPRLNAGNSNRIYACIGDASQSYLGIPSTTASTGFTFPAGIHPAFDSNGVQSVLALSDPSGLLHVHYAPTFPLVFSDVFTTPANTGVANVYGLEMGSTYTHVLYPDSNIGGQLRDSRAAIYTFLQGPPRYFFCSDPSDANFAYNYKEDVTTTATNSASFLGGEPAYFFVGDDDEFAYLGKYVTNGDTGLNTTARFEAATEGFSSVFRIAYSYVNSVPSSNSKGDGGYPTGTNSFSSFVEAYFEEFGNSWKVSINEKAGAGSPRVARTLIQGGNSIFQGTPNDRHTYQFQVDTTQNPPLATLKYEGAVIASATLDVATGAKLYAQWFVGYGTANTFSNDAETGLSQTDQLSTCIWTLSGVGTTPNPGTSPLSTIGPAPTITATGTASASSGGLFNVNAQTVPSGFTVSTFSMFLGLLLTAAIAAAFYFIGKSPLMAGGGGVLGFFMSYAFGLFPLWVILIGVLLAAVVVVLKFRSG